MLRRPAFLLALAFVALTGVAWGAIATARFRIAGLPEIVVTADGTSVDVDPDTVGGASKRAAVVAAVVSGQQVYMLLRFERSGTGIFVDTVFSDSLANLTTAIEAADYSTVVGHPSPADDTTDASAITAAGG